MSPSAPTYPAAGTSPAREALADAALLAVDALLLTGAALRITRFATTDTLGGWVLADPLKRWAERRDPRPAHYSPAHYSPTSPTSPASQASPASPASHPSHPFGYAAPPEAWRHRLVSALDCPYCVGTQATLAIAAVLAALPASPSHRPAVRTAGRLARSACAALAASYLVGHVSYRLDSKDAK